MSEAKWLVKSSGRILGPCTIEEIVESMRTKTFSVLDEIREPRTRWTFLREHPMLMNVVRQIRDEQASGFENTQSTFVTGGKTVTSSVTERITEESELTPDPTGLPLAQMKSISATEKNVALSASGAKSFGVLSDHKVQNQIQRQASQWKYILYGLGAVALVGAGLYLRTQSGSSLSGTQATEMIKLAQDRARVAEYEQALKMVQDVENVRGLSGPDKVFKLKLLLAIDDSSAIDISRTMDDVQAAGQGVSSVNLDLLRGLSQARIGKYPEAEKSYQSALRENKNNEEAILGLAATHLMAEELSKASLVFTDRRINEHRPYYQVLRSLIVLAWPNAKGQEDILRSAFNEFRDFDSALDQRLQGNETQSIPNQRPDQVKIADAGHELRFERLLLLGLIAQRLGEQEWVEQLRRKIVQANPFESKKYLRSPLLDWQVLDWPRAIRGHCESFVKGHSDDAIMRSISALCAGGAGDLVGARNTITAANRQFVGDTNVAATDALLLMAAGRDNEAERIVQMYALSDRILINWVRGELCEKKSDTSCAHRAWTKVNALDPFEPRAYQGLALAAKNMTSETNYVHAIGWGAKYGPSYVPLLKLTGSRDEF